MAAYMLAHLNNLLPDTHQIDPAYVKAIKAKGYSDQLQQHAILDRLEARLRTLDKKKDGKIVRSWEGTWASDVLETPEYKETACPSICCVITSRAAFGPPRRPSSPSCHQLLVPRLPLRIQP